MTELEKLVGQLRDFVFLLASAMVVGLTIGWSIGPILAKLGILAALIRLGEAVTATLYYLISLAIPAAPFVLGVLAVGCTAFVIVTATKRNADP